MEFWRDSFIANFLSIKGCSNFQTIFRLHKLRILIWKTCYSIKAIWHKSSWNFENLIETQWQLCAPLFFFDLIKVTEILWLLFLYIQHARNKNFKAKIPEFSYNVFKLFFATIVIWCHCIKFNRPKESVVNLYIYLNANILYTFSTHYVYL